MSVGLSAVLVALAIVLFFVLCLKGFGMIPTALICTVIVGFAVEGGPVSAIWGPFASGMGGFAGGLAFPFLVGGIFGGVMTASGSSEKFGQTLIHKFGIRFAPYALMIFVMVLNYVNIISFPILGAILAFSLMKAADLPRNVACVAMVGGSSIAAFLLPGAVATANMTAASFYGTTLYAGGAVGAVMAVIGFALVAFYVEYLCRDYRKKGIGYTPTDMEQQLGTANGAEDLPSFFVSVLPIIVVIGLAMVCQLMLNMNPYAACVVAQFVGILLCLALNFHRFSGKIAKTIADGTVTSCVPLLQTCMVVGFASVVTATPIYNALMNTVMSWNMNPYLLCVLGTMLFACISADPISGITLSGQMLASRCIELGGNAALLHRLTLAASTTFDSMPYSGNLNVSMNFLGLTHKDVYKQIVVVQIGVTTFYTIVGLIISVVIG